MLFFKKNTLTKDDAQSVKTIRIGSFKYKIRKINPLLDFTAETMPQIFSAYLTKRALAPADSPVTIQQLQRYQEDMKAVVAAGLVKPALIPIGKGELRGKEAGITIDDIFRDEDSACRLYIEILTHSLNKFRGLKGVFFSIRIKHILYTEWQKSMASYQAILSLQAKTQA